MTPQLDNVAQSRGSVEASVESFIPVDYGGRSFLVTGGAGFIGSHLVDALVARHARVTVVDDLSSGKMDNLRAARAQVTTVDLDLHQGDLRPVLREQQIEIIFHVAGGASVPDSVRDPRQDFEKNAVASFNLLEAVRRGNSAARVIFTSTAAVYGEQYGEGRSWKLFREDDPTAPASPYAVSKLAAERYMDVYARLYGLRTASLRLFPVYGPRLRKQVVYDLMCKLRENPNELSIHGDGTQVRDFTSIANVVDALLVVAEKAPLTGEVYNVGTGELVSIGELAGMICEFMSVAPRFVYTGTTLPGISQGSFADISRIMGLGYRPIVKMAEGLRHTVEWFQAECASAS